MTKLYNIKELAIQAKLHRNTLSIEIRKMLQDPSIKAEFGRYKFKRFTQNQLKILIKNIPNLDHLDYLVKDSNND